MAAQVPIMEFFAVRWLRQPPRYTLPVLAPQAGAAMNAIAPPLVAASAAIILLLGLLHLLYTFYGPKLFPRDRELQTRMQEVSPVITRQTTMWKAWVGFNASHSYGLILFGAVYGYLALAHSDFLFQSVFLLLLGLILLFGYVFLAKRYFFRIPFRGTLLATILYTLALIIRWT
ncbi:LIC_13387 family protein [Collimonas humicola]|uniref:LIC_13387 family protein n=1 Tax=Collimonas humicola TaxID=2825886 RepID=UPI001B8C43FA|nr:hypothetical protein [Collimonas humicola]